MFAPGKVIAYCYCCIFLLLLPACSDLSATSTDTRTKYIKQLVEEAIAISDSSASQALLYLNNGYAQMSDIRMEDMLPIYQYKMNHYTKIGSLDEANLYTDSVLSVSLTGSKYNQLRILAFINKGDILVKMGRHDESLQWFYKGKRLAEKTKDLYSMSIYGMKLGLVKYRQGRYKDAIADFRRSYKDNDACGLRHDFQNLVHRNVCLTNIILCHVLLMQHDSALYYSRIGLRRLEQNRKYFNAQGQAKYPEMAKAVIYGNISDVYLQRKEYTRAAELLRQSIQINSRKNYDQVDAQSARIKLFHIYLLSDSLSPIPLLRKEISANVFADLNANLFWHKLSARYMSRISDTVQAYKYLEKYYYLKDSLTRSHKNFKEINFERELDKMKQIYEMQIEGREQKIKNIGLYTSAICLLLTFLLVFVIFRNWKNSQERMRNLKVMNKQLEMLLDTLMQSTRENERILKTVAHDMRNPITGISVLADTLFYKDAVPDKKNYVSIIKGFAVTSLQHITALALPPKVANKREDATEDVDIRLVLVQSVQINRLGATDRGIRIDTDVPVESILMSTNKIRLWHAINSVLYYLVRTNRQGRNIDVNMKAGASDISIIFRGNSGVTADLSMVDNLYQVDPELAISKQMIELLGGRVKFDISGSGIITIFVKFPKNKA